MADILSAIGTLLTGLAATGTLIWEVYTDHRDNPRGKHRK